MRIHCDHVCQVLAQFLVWTLCMIAGVTTERQEGKGKNKVGAVGRRAIPMAEE